VERSIEVAELWAPRDDASLQGVWEKGRGKESTSFVTEVPGKDLTEERNDARASTRKKMQGMKGNGGLTLDKGSVLFRGLCAARGGVQLT